MHDIVIINLFNPLNKVEFENLIHYQSLWIRLNSFNEPISDRSEPNSSKSEHNGIIIIGLLWPY